MKFIETFENLINKWMDVRVPFEIFDTVHKKRPSFLSIAYKESETGLVKILNGGVTRSEIIPDNGYLLFAMLGDSKRGNGYDYLGIDEVPFNPEKLAITIDSDFDEVLKGAMSKYVSIAKERIAEQNHEFYNLSSEPVVEYFENIENGSGIVMPTRAEIRRFERISKKLKNIPNVEISDITVKTISMKRRFVNSEGTKIRTKDLRGSAHWNLEFRNNEGFIRNIEGSFHYTRSKWNDLFSLESRIDNIAKHVEALSEARPLFSGEYPVVMHPSAFGTVMHEAIVAHLLSGKYISEKLANTFADKIGRKVMPSFLTVSVEPNARGGYGSYKYDEEGVKSKDEVLVEEGILKTYLLDRMSSHSLGLENNGYSRSEWVVESIVGDETNSVLQEPRVSNIRIKAKTNKSEKDLIRMMMKHCERKGFEFGLYIKGVSGDVRIEEGTFHMLPDEIWAIYPNGKRKLMTDAHIVENPYKLLNGIKACNKNYRKSFGRCGAESGWVSTQTITPSAYFPAVNFQKITEKQFTDKLIIP